MKFHFQCVQNACSLVAIVFQLRRKIKIKFPFQCVYLSGCVYLSANRFSISQRNENQILFSFFVFRGAVKKRNSTSMRVPYIQCQPFFDFVEKRKSNFISVFRFSRFCKNTNFDFAFRFSFLVFAWNLKNGLQVKSTRFSFFAFASGTETDIPWENSLLQVGILPKITTNHDATDPRETSEDLPWVVLESYRLEVRLRSTSDEVPSRVIIGNCRLS